MKPTLLLLTMGCLLRADDPDFNHHEGDYTNVLDDHTALHESGDPHTVPEPGTFWMLAGFVAIGAATAVARRRTS